MRFDPFSTLQDFLAGQREHVLIWVPVFLGLGAALYFALPFEPSYLSVGAALSATATLFFFLFRGYQCQPDNVPALVGSIAAACGLCVLIGFSAGQIKTHVLNTPMLDRETRPVMVVATVEHKEEQEGKKGTLFFLTDVSIANFSADKTPHSIRLTLKKPTDATAGDQVKMLAKLTPLSLPVAPDAYDFARHYYFEGIGAMGYALSDIEILKRAEPNIFDLESLREKISSAIKKVVTERQAGIVSALMTGERAAIADEDWDALRASGLAHIISISGMHVAMVAAPVFFLVRLFLAMIPYVALRWPIKKIAACAALAVCCLYVGLVVPSVPTTRSLLMTGIGLIAIMLDRSPFSLRLVAFSAILVLLISPESIWSVSFQMSFAAVTALVAMAEAMRPYLIAAYQDAGWIKRGVLFFVGMIVTSCVASLATAPYSLYHFQQVANYSVLANTISVPISGLMIMPMLMVSYILLPFGAADWSLKLMGQGVEWLLDVARWTQALPGSVLTTAAMPDSFLILVTMFGLILILCQGRAKCIACIPLVVAIVLAGVTRGPDVLVAPEGTVMAINGGSKIYVSDMRHDKFAVETWLKRWHKTAEDVAPFPRQGNLNTENGAKISCDAAVCRIEVQGKKLSYGSKFYELHQDCEWADVMISDLRLPRDFCGGSPVKVFGYYDFKTNGAMAINWGGHLTMQRANTDRAGRPWGRAARR